tara:strand:+ start:490 stop:744 length:255 start_codon:yes stop_codon:yes gene_type:complete
MLLLFETPAGFSLFKVKDEGKLEDAEVSAPDVFPDNFAPGACVTICVFFLDGWGLEVCGGACGARVVHPQREIVAINVWRTRGM